MSLRTPYAIALIGSVIARLEVRARDPGTEPGMQAWCFALIDDLGQAVALLEHPQPPA
jgi:hypothetical protein